MPQERLEIAKGCHKNSLCVSESGVEQINEDRGYRHWHLPVNVTWGFAQAAFQD